MFSNVYIVDAVRSPVGRLYGKLSGVRADDMLRYYLDVLTARQDWLREQCDALVVGCANQAGEDNRNIARMGVLLAGLSPTIHALTTNSLCASGMDAVVEGARMIALGEAAVVIVGGVEVMSRSPYIEDRTNGQRVDSTIGWRFINPALYHYYQPHSMPQTAELLAERCGISRAQQDAYAVASRQRYQQALERGDYKSEIVEMSGLLRMDEQHKLLSATALKQLPTVVEGGRHITLANSARIGDGAALLVLASEAIVERYKLKPLARVRSWGQAAVHPDEMGTALVPAVLRALERGGWGTTMLDRLEWSEAFAVQTLACAQGLNVDMERVNPNGGELSIGKPLGSAGARLVVSLAWAMQQGKDNIRKAVAATCAGLGVGTAVLLERV